jgi:hypothetical protein
LFGIYEYDALTSESRRFVQVECELKEDADEDPLGDGHEDEGHLLDPRLRDKRKLEVIFRTREDCRTCGRSYIYRSTYQDAVEWEKCVDDAVKKAKQRKHDETMQRLYGHSSFEMYRARWKERIESPR